MYNLYVYKINIDNLLYIVNIIDYMNLILDMDGTLIDSYFSFDTGKMVIIPRPYLKEFFDFAFENFTNVSIWTNGTKEWYDEVCKRVLLSYIPIGKSFHFVKTRTNLFDTNIIKPLSEIYKIYSCYNNSNTFILDDNPDTYVCNVENSIPITTFETILDDENKNCNNDNELIKVISLLKIMLLFNESETPSNK